MSANAVDGERPALFLPDFCSIRTVFTVVVVGELLAIVLALDPGARARGGWRELALTSLFVQWTALGSIALLCWSRRWLERLDARYAAAISYLLIVGVTLVVSEVAWWVFIPRLELTDAAQMWRYEPGPGGGSLTPIGGPAPLPHLEFLLRTTGIGAIVAAVALRYFFLQHQSKARMESETRARIQALQSRIRPHFLFNSMNTIASLARSAPELAEQVTEDLASLFRVSLSDASVPGTLAQELEVCQQYLRIEAQRLGDRLVAEVDADDLPGQALLPALSLQPLVENAVYHGIEPAPDGGYIRVRGARRGERVVLTVENSLPPASEPALRRGNRMALDNVRQRLDAFFAGRAQLRVTPGEGRFTVELEFPVTMERA